MDKLTGQNGSCLHNCIIIGRKEDLEKGVTLFDGSGPNVTCRLNGYAIIPVEEYYQLKNEPVPPGTGGRIAQKNIGIYGKMSGN